MKRIVKWASWFVFLFSALTFIGMIWGLTPYPKPPKGVRLAPLRPPLPLAELHPDNAAYFYFKACDLLTGYKQSSESSTQMNAILEGDSISSTTAIETTLSDCREAIELVRKGTSAGFCQMPLVELGEPTRFGEKLRQLGRLLTCEGKLAERRGNIVEALETYLVVAKLGRDCTRGGPIITVLVGNSITGRGTQAIRYAICQRAAPKETVSATQSKLQELREIGQTFDETLRYELVCSKQMCQQTFAQYKTPWATATAGSYRHLADAAFGELIEDAANPVWQRHGDAIIRKWSMEGRPRWMFIWNRPIARMLLEMLLPAIDSLGRRFVRADVDLQATVVAYALKRYEMDHSKPPETLGNLIPDCLTVVPIDPFDGKPLRYRREGKEWVIWSVGSDLKDDNATWHEFKYHERGKERKGGDIYFKSTEPQDDLAAYRASRKRSSNASN